MGNLIVKILSIYTVVVNPFSECVLEVAMPGAVKRGGVETVHRLPIREINYGKNFEH